jgi:hypothetical protein
MTPRVLLGLARPRGMVWVPSLPLLGFGFAHWEYALDLTNGGAMAKLVVAWLLLHAGAMWLNAALDRDQGEVLLGRAFPVPAGADRLGFVALALGTLVATWGGAVAGTCAAGCSALAVLYSYPAFAWKGHPVGGPLVNLIGYGLLSPAAGWSLVGVPIGVRPLAALGVVVSAILGTYFAAQAFQRDEDDARGYRTLVVTHGPAAALGTARVALACGATIAVGMSVVGWFPRPCLVSLPAWIALDRSLAVWVSDPTGGTESDARRMVRRLILAGALLVTGAYAEYARERITGVAVAGLGTPPPPRLDAWR